MRTLTAILTVISISTVTGCATKDDIIPTPDQTMQEVYENHMGGVSDGKVLDTRSVLRRPMVQPDVDLSDYVRTEKNFLQSRFRTLPNPTMYMFVAPHLATENGVPIPGYITEFKMWKTEHYAMPGEISDMASNFGAGQ